MAVQICEREKNAFHFNHLLSKQSVSSFNRGARVVLEMQFLLPKGFQLTNMTNRIEKLNHSVLTCGLMMGTRL